MFLAPLSKLEYHPDYGCEGAMSMRSFRSLALASIMSALSVVLTRFASIRVAFAGVEGVRLGLGPLPNILVGIVAGPLYGAASGAVSDLVGYALSPMGGAYMPHFTLTAALMGGIPGFVYQMLRRKDRRHPSVALIMVCVGASSLLVSLGLTPYFLNLLFGLPYKALIPPRAAAAVIEVPVYSILIRAVIVRYGGMARSGRSR